MTTNLENQQKKQIKFYISSKQVKFKVCLKHSINHSWDNGFRKKGLGGNVFYHYLLFYFEVPAEKWVHFIQIFRGKKSQTSQTILLLQFIVLSLLLASRGTSLTDDHYLHLSTFSFIINLLLETLVFVYVELHACHWKNPTFLNVKLSYCALIKKLLALLEQHLAVVFVCFKPQTVVGNYQGFTNPYKSQGKPNTLFPTLHNVNKIQTIKCIENILTLHSRNSFVFFSHPLCQISVYTSIKGRGWTQSRTNQRSFNPEKIYESIA